MTPTTRQSTTCFVLCVPPEFDRVQKKDLVCWILEQLKNAHVGNSQVQARWFVTYQREYENFTHHLGKSIDTMF
jgi:hypothetical protein